MDSNAILGKRERIGLLRDLIDQRQRFLFALFAGFLILGIIGTHIEMRPRYADGEQKREDTPNDILSHSESSLFLIGHTAEKATAELCIIRRAGFADIPLAKLRTAQRGELCAFNLSGRSEYRL